MRGVRPSVRTQLFEEDWITTRRVTETYFFSVLRLLQHLYNVTSHS